jgi:hypothetical protein
MVLVHQNALRTILAVAHGEDLVAKLLKRNLSNEMA